MADTADTADSLHEDRRLPVRVTLDEPLVAAELDHVQLGIGDVVVVIEFDDHLPMSLDAGDRIDHDRLRHARCPLISRTGSVSWQIHRAPVDQILEHVEDRVGTRRATRQEIVHVHDLVARVHVICEDRDPPVEGHHRT